MSAPVQNAGALVRGARKRFLYLYLQQDAINPDVRDPAAARRLLLDGMKFITQNLKRADELIEQGDTEAAFLILNRLQF